MFEEAFNVIWEALSTDAIVAPEGIPVQATAMPTYKSAVLERPVNTLLPPAAVALRLAT